MRKPLDQDAENAFQRVLNYLRRQWYEVEYGAVENDKRWYQPAMYRLEDLDIAERFPKVTA